MKLISKYIKWPEYKNFGNTSSVTSKCQTDDWNSYGPEDQVGSDCMSMQALKSVALTIRHCVKKKKAKRKVNHSFTHTLKYYREGIGQVP